MFRLHLKRLCYAMFFLFWAHGLSAQTDINTSFSNRMNYIFQILEKNRVPHGLLLDYAIEFTNLSNFNGSALADSNKVMTAEFWDIYNTLYLSRIHPNGFTIQNPTLFDSLWYHQRDTGKIVLAGLFYNSAFAGVCEKCTTLFLPLQVFPCAVAVVVCFHQQL